MTREIGRSLAVEPVVQMDKRKAQVPLVCHGHSRPIVDLSYSPITPDGFFLVSASKGMAFFFFFFFSFLSS